MGALPAIYLGMPLGAKSQSKEIWNSVLEKCEKKLVRWKAQYLSKGGRLTLINAVLDALPTYMLTLFPIPAGVVQRLDKLRRDFFWQGNKKRKGYHLVKWKVMITGKKQGGLGIKNLKNQSKALKLKWLWRYAHEPHSMWSKVIKLKYGEMDSWVTKEATNPYGVTVWRSIRNWWPFLRNHTTITVHNGVRTQFWKDRWLGNQNLSEIFPDIFDLALHKDRTVAEMWSPQGWDLSL